MRRLWDKGEGIDATIHRFTVGEDYLLDARLVRFDIQASVAHATMLGEEGLIPAGVAERICAGLIEVGKAHDAGQWTISSEQEDCHTAIEFELEQLIGSDAGHVHLGRSRNDQVLAALRLYLMNAAEAVDHLLESTQVALISLQARSEGVALPGYTHLQRAMPSSVEDWLGGYIAELGDDRSSLREAARHASRNPLGSAAGYGAPGLNLNRERTTELLGFAETQEPSTAVQLSRGKAEASFAFALTLIAQDLGRLASDFVLFASQEFGFVALDASITTGSSIMPQKRNPDVFELIRGRGVQASSDLTSILNITSKMTSGYHRDLQLIKAPLFRLIDSTAESLRVMALALAKVNLRPDRIEAAMDPSLFAAEAAYRLVREEGIPFREAYRIIGERFKT